jgi:Carbohydrate-binding family 9
MDIPEWRVPYSPSQKTDDLMGMDWDAIPVLPSFRLAENGATALQQTRCRLCWNEHALYVRFDCEDRDIWSTWTHHDDPIYDEEAVEVFISPGDETPAQYYEFEVNPNAVVFDALIDNPTSQRRNLHADLAWDCQGLRVCVERDDPHQLWTAIMAIPWAQITPNATLPHIWRANLYRIERPHDASPEFSCWSPTYATPTDFHKPEAFGRLVLEPVSL